MTEKEIEKETQRVRAANAEFERLDPPGKRVAIAKDVIRQLDAAKLEAAAGAWILRGRGEDSSAYLVRPGEMLPDDAQLADYLPTIESCTTCALGALFYCTVTNADRLTAGELRDKISSSRSSSLAQSLYMAGEPPFLSYLERFFGKEQLRLIEVAFEQGQGWIKDDDDDLTEDEDVAKDMFLNTDAEYDDDLRLRAIMRNVMRNHGKFDPHDKRGLNGR